MDCRQCESCAEARRSVFKEHERDTMSEERCPHRQNVPESPCCPECWRKLKAENERLLGAVAVMLAETRANMKRVQELNPSNREMMVGAYHEVEHVLLQIQSSTSTRKGGGVPNTGGNVAGSQEPPSHPKAEAEDPPRCLRCGHPMASHVIDGESGWCEWSPKDYIYECGCDSPQPPPPGPKREAGVSP